MPLQQPELQFLKILPHTSRNRDRVIVPHAIYLSINPVFAVLSFFLVEPDFLLSFTPISKLRALSYPSVLSPSALTNAYIANCSPTDLAFLSLLEPQ